MFTPNLTYLHKILLQGNVIQCSAKATIAFNFHQLGKGVQFSIEDFVVQSNNEEYHARENNTFKLDFDGATTLRKSPVLCDQYVRYPLQKIHMDNMKPTRNKSLIGKFVLINFI